MGNIKKEFKSIELVQKWVAGKINIGSQFLLKDLNRTINLIEFDGYPFGKFVFENGEEFNIGKFPTSTFIDTKYKEDENDSIYDEELWNQVDFQLNGNNNSIVRKNFISQQNNSDFKKSYYIDVSEIIDNILIECNPNNSQQNIKYLNNLKEQLENINYPYFTKEELKCIFSFCKFKKSKLKNVYHIIMDNKDIGYLLNKDNKYYYSPRNKIFKKEYCFESDSSLGFFNTADSYLDIALSTIKNYQKKYLAIYHNDLNKNNISYGYQADSSIKTLLSFSCECYLKSLLIDNGLNFEDTKKLSHNLTSLFTSLKDEQIADIFSIMEKLGFNKNEYFDNKDYSPIDLTDKFMLDLACVDDAFQESRYCAESDKNTDYLFLYNFSLSLRYFIKQAKQINSPFENSIQDKVGKM